ncbi:integrase [Paenibacillus phyllosphaerae]|uniref:Integrase n=1 Tax=Paenibacillus phyllosphaerae TaxID=274593 RepID=A0A7W5B391_9BACL|nr:tyrosine-type recombinase/integrase [Paenibacillus phyllosphaerae]MBB3113615.1 integrase [Paenibacillus phyllosphaerae]
MPVYEDKKLKKNKWWFEVELGKNLEGKRVRKKQRGFRTKKEAERAMVELQHQINQGGRPLDISRVHYGDFLQEWLEKKRSSISLHTERTYQVYIKLHILPKLGSVPIAQLTPYHIESFVSHLIRDKQLAPETIHRILSVVHTSLNAAERLDLVQKNVARGIEKPRVPHRELQVWDPEYVGQFLTHIKGRSRYSIAFYLAVMTGMRQGEILGLRWSDIELNGGIIRIQQTLSHDGKQLIAGAKTAGSIRSVTISPATIQMLQEHRQLIDQERAAGDASYQHHDLVVCTSRGTPTSGRAIMKVWYKLLQEHQAPPITFHDLRHTHASLLLRQGVHIKVVSERLGHSTVSMTLNRYSHLLPNMQSEAARGLDELLFGI